SPAAPTSAARSASPRRSTASSGSKRRTAACRPALRTNSTANAHTERTGARYTLDGYGHDGAMARTIADCALFENVIAGPHPADITSLRPKLEIPERLEGIDGLRIGLSIDLGSWDVEDEVAANTRAVGDALIDAGAKVDEVEVP